MQTVNILFLFYLLIGMFALIGAMRGWAKELLVTFSVILAIFLLELIQRFVLKSGQAPASSATADQVSQAPISLSTIQEFWLSTLIVGGLSFFGYQTGLLQRFVGGNKLAREKVQDMLLGVLVGALNGFMIVGSIWYFMDEAGYPFHQFIAAPTGDAIAKIDALMNFMPPHLFGAPTIYFAVGLAFLFVLVVFI